MCVGGVTFSDSCPQPSSPPPPALTLPSRGPGPCRAERVTPTGVPPPSHLQSLRTSLLSRSLPRGRSASPWPRRRPPASPTGSRRPTQQRGIPVYSEKRGRDYTAQREGSWVVCSPCADLWQQRGASGRNVHEKDEPRGTASARTIFYRQNLQWLISPRPDGDKDCQLPPPKPRGQHCCREAERWRKRRRLTCSPSVREGPRPQPVSSGHELRAGPVTWPVTPTSAKGTRRRPHHRGGHTRSACKSRVTPLFSSALGAPTAAADNAYVKGRGCVPIKLYLQTRAGGRSWLTGLGVPTSAPSQGSGLPA